MLSTDFSKFSTVTLSSSNSTKTLADAKFTLADLTPSSEESMDSTLCAQTAQLIRICFFLYTHLFYVFMNKNN